MRKFKVRPEYNKTNATYLHPEKGEVREVLREGVVYEGNVYSQFVDAGLMYEVFDTDKPVQATKAPVVTPIRFPDIPPEMISPFRLRTEPVKPVATQVEEQSEPVQVPVQETVAAVVEVATVKAVPMQAPAPNRPGRPAKKKLP